MGGGKVVVERLRPDHLTALVAKLRDIGVPITVAEDSILVDGAGRPKAVDISTEVYPGFPTDLQAQMMACLALADGTSRITETIYPDRFAHVAELRRLGADISISGNAATVHGVPALQGTYVRSMDLRASASLILAGLVAVGETAVTHVHHLDRGYAGIEDKLRGLGAVVERMPDPNGDE